jgi:phenylalanyl-tRNA synthetase beta chain
MRATGSSAGVDPQSCVDGLNLALALIVEFGGGTVSKANVAGMIPARADKVTFYPADVERLTGLTVKSADMRRILKDLEFAIEDAGDAWYLMPPSFRFDMEQSADIVEEIARMVGYDQLPTTSLPAPEGGVRAITTPMQARVRTARRVLAARGFLEAVTWSFMSKANAALFGKTPDSLTVVNPVASDLNQMRPSILANLAERCPARGEPGRAGRALLRGGPDLSGRRAGRPAHGGGSARPPGGRTPLAGGAEAL